MLLVKIAGGCILFGWQEPSLQSLAAACDCLFCKVSEQRRLDRPADYAAAEQKGIDLAGVTFVAGDRYPNQAVIAEAIMQANRENLACRILRQPGNLLVRVTASRNVELIRFLRELRNAGQRGGRDCRDLSFLFQEAIEIFFRLKFLFSLGALALFGVKRRAQLVFRR